MDKHTRTRAECKKMAPIRDGAATLCINTSRAETQARIKSNQAHLHSNHFHASSGSSSHRGVVSRFGETRFLGTQLHADAVLRHPMNILPQTYVTRLPGAAVSRSFWCSSPRRGGRRDKQFGKIKITHDQRRALLGALHYSSEQRSPS